MSLPADTPPITGAVALPRTPAIGVASFAGRGRGVVARVPIRRGELLEVAPVLPLLATDSPPPHSALYDYPFAWDEPPFVEAIVFGLCSLVNHSPRPNVALERDIAARLLRLVALTDIPAGTELTYDYGIPLWFEAR